MQDGLNPRVQAWAIHPLQYSVTQVHSTFAMLPSEAIQIIGSRIW